VIDGMHDCVPRIATRVEQAFVLGVEHVAAPGDRSHAARAGGADAFGPVDLDLRRIAREPAAQRALDLGAEHLR
jgi:hypothetical protein